MDDYFVVKGDRMNTSHNQPSYSERTERIRVIFSSFVSLLRLAIVIWVFAR